jgi:hypothetical protein
MPDDTSTQQDSMQLPEKGGLIIKKKQRPDSEVTNILSSVMNSKFLKSHYWDWISWLEEKQIMEIQKMILALHLMIVVDKLLLGAGCETIIKRVLGNKPQEVKDKVLQGNILVNDILDLGLEDQVNGHYLLPIGKRKLQVDKEAIEIPH